MSKQTESKNNLSAIVSKAVLSQRITENLKEKHEIVLSKNLISLVIDEMWEAIIQALEKKEEIRMVGYCSFKSSRTKQRTAMNLKTNQKMIIPEKTVAKVKLSQVIKQRLAQL